MFSNMQMRIYLFLILALILSSCDNDSAIEKEIAKVDISYSLERFDSDFEKARPEDLPKLKSTYPFLFSRRVPDSVWIKMMSDTLQQQMFDESSKVFKSTEILEEDIQKLFQHLKYYNKTFKIPRVITVLNTVDYKNKTIVNDTIVLIDLMNYLGRDHDFYQNVQMYISDNMKPSQILPDLADSYSKKYIYQSQRKTLLDEMIYFGKSLYFKDVMIPSVSDADKIGYSQVDLDWASLNENQIWSYFVEREMLFSTDAKLINRFIALAPFSKFYLELDNESPGRLGQYIGWQIVKAYADKTGEDVLTIMQKEAEEIFRKSKYKPKK